MDINLTEEEYYPNLPLFTQPSLSSIVLPNKGKISKYRKGESILSSSSLTSLILRAIQIGGTTPQNGDYSYLESLLKDEGAMKKIIR